MCARRFLTMVFVLTLLAVAGAFAIYQYGGRVLIRQAVPHGHFEPAKAGGGPDYSLAANWLARPGLTDDPSEWRPDGVAAHAPGKAAIFFIHPTTYIQTDRWNAPLVVGGDTEFRTRLFVQSQASAFNGAGEIWAPRYRQAAYGSFLLKSADAEKALDFAYRDVAAAFDRFMAEAGDRPIILAGHSQGALHLERLLREKIAGKPIAKRIVAAYVVGWPISTTADLPALGLPACGAADQAGCILSWMTFADPPNPDFIFHEWARTKGYNGGDRRQADTLCVNPLNGVQNSAAPASDNPGTLIPTADMRSATVDAGAVGAHCAKGLLILDGLPPALGSFVLPGNNYHVYDYALFWGAVRRDAERRLAAWPR
jgi:pimeloyl-ACP methyl ester carboxylesterase